MRNPLEPAPRIALVASIAWTLWNYRLSLIKELESAGYEVILLAADDASRLHLEQHTWAKFFPLRQLSRRSISLYQNLKFLFEIFFVLRHHRPDVALFFTIRPNTLGNLAAAAAGVPSISTVEGMGISGSSQGWLRRITLFLYRLAFRHASKVIFLNNDDLQDFTRQRIVNPQKALLIHGPGIDLQHFAPQAKVSPSEKTVFLFVARLLSEKGICEFVEAARLLKSKGVAAEFRVLGSTDSGNPTTISDLELESWVQEDIIQHLGFLDDVRPAIAACDFLVLPSYYREGVPRSVLEAMSMEKPIITTDNVGCRDTVEEGKNGFLIPSRNVAALADTMEKAIALSLEQRAEMGRWSRQMAESEFGDQWVLPRYLALIQEVLTKH
ncbi:MAG: glycosyltransferase family 4 protein [Phycisphaerae bacterium]|nr:glycosyltransferase family 4 protein [Saprospiraceae bacterium]